MSKLIPIIYMIGVLLLVLPSFIKSNQNLKTFLTNLSLWIALILVIFSFKVFKLDKSKDEESIKSPPIKTKSYDLFFSCKII